MHLSLIHNAGRVEVLHPKHPQAVVDITDQEAAQRLILYPDMLAAIKGFVAAWEMMRAVLVEDASR